MDVGAAVAGDLANTCFCGPCRFLGKVSGQFHRERFLAGYRAADGEQRTLMCPPKAAI